MEIPVEHKLVNASKCTSDGCERTIKSESSKDVDSRQDVKGIQVFYITKLDETGTCE
jgi:hypothetical protein